MPSRERLYPSIFIGYKSFTTFPALSSPIWLRGLLIILPNVMPRDSNTPINHNDMAARIPKTRVMA
jgi:hypothetical protein